ncbi:protein-glucosylgalactosylhydroxylysine glucosidase-like [Mya arenaria]|uniref:protein-glucosylgalactosylhydroxylysine glucosidase-like n=1 Tax=Mya arenaria TaxID=6604 RepID=UPI0022E74E93|nr:protein-glucosylgalactosylhydroxylysine glucosidase-like [Mya arenaria]
MYLGEAFMYFCYIISVTLLKWLGTTNYATQYFVNHGCTLQKNIDADKDGWDLCTDTPPADAKLWPSISNGHVGTVVHSDSVYMNGLYNGNGTTSTRARIPAFTSLDVINFAPDENVSTTYCLHMNSGIYEEIYRGDHWRVTVTMYAHRVFNRLLVTELTVATDGQQRTLTIPLKVNHGNQSSSVTLQDATSDVASANYKYGTILEAETPESGLTPVHVYYKTVPLDVTVDSGHSGTETLVFLMSVSTNQADAAFAFTKGRSLYLEGTLRSSHVTKWHEVWDTGRIDVIGNVTLASSVYSALYYITSAMPLQEDTVWPFVGLSPADLAHNGYNGHVFWDQDTWMYPPVLVLHGDLAPVLLNTRFRTLNASREFARRTGHSGAQYAWESAFTGLDVTPWPPAQDYEHHVTGDVALALRQYVMMAGDSPLLHDVHFRETVFAIAEFWKSRSVLNRSTGMYEIHNVMPPDEWHYPVNNSVYTNYVAKMALLLPHFLCDVIHCLAPPEFEQVAGKMYIPFDADKNYHPEYDGYTKNVSVKQGDGILLGFPLQLAMTSDVRRNDLEIYENTTGAGPAMTWGMFAIGWLELNQTDRAEGLFFRQLLNKYGAFNIWTEDADGGGVTNFITGQGGYLQSIIHGYGGVRPYADRLALHCRPVPGSTGISIVGLDYLGNSLDISCDDRITKVVRTSHGRQLYLYTSLTREIIPLRPGVPVDLPSQPLAISSYQTLKLPIGQFGVNVPVEIVG